jgi:ribosomal protein S18 acetylase RimI-like enzyme
MTIRTATRDDIEAVLEFWVGADAEPSVSDDVAGLARLIQHDPGALLLAESGGRIVGSLIAGWDGWRGNMYRLAVAPDQRRRGVARALVQAGEERLSKLGARRVGAAVMVAREVPNATWMGVGYGDNPPLRRYSKNLPPAGR